MSDLDRIARLRIVLLDTKPAVWRVVEVPLTTTLRALHEVIQAAMPFQNYHLYEFRIGEHRYGIPDPDFDADLPTRDAKSIRLSRFLGEGVSTFTYVYDFGDNWQHAVTVEVMCDGEPGTNYPYLIDGAGRAPPKDVGGTPGFEELVRVMGRPRAQAHGGMVRRPVRSGRDRPSDDHGQARQAGSAPFTGEGRRPKGEDENLGAGTMIDLGYLPTRNDPEMAN